MKRAILFLKAAIPGGAMGDLFDQTVQVRGHTRGGVYVAPHTAHRKKAAPEAPAAIAARILQTHPAPTDPRFKVNDAYARRIASEWAAKNPGVIRSNGEMNGVVDRLVSMMTAHTKRLEGGGRQGGGLAPAPEAKAKPAPSSLSPEAAEEWRKMLAQGSALRRRARELTAQVEATPSKSLRFQHKDGRMSLVSPDLDEKGKFRVTTFAADKTPWGHYVVNTLHDALLEVLRGGAEPVAASDRKPKAAPAPAPPAAGMGPALAALAPNTVYGGQAWQDAWERATEGERGRMERYAAEAAKAKAAGHMGTERRSLERLDMMRAGIMERAVRQARDEFHGDKPADRGPHDTEAEAAQARRLGFKWEAGSQKWRHPFQASFGAARARNAVDDHPQLAGNELRRLYREAVHGAGAEPRRAARAKIDALLADTGMSMRDAFERERLDMAAYFASRPIS